MTRKATVTMRRMIAPVGIAPFCMGAVSIGKAAGC